MVDSRTTWTMTAPDFMPTALSMPNSRILSMTAVISVFTSPKISAPMITKNQIRMALST